jgi:hypothetical protein
MRFFEVPGLYQTFSELLRAVQLVGAVVLGKQPQCDCSHISDCSSYDDRAICGHPRHSACRSALDEMENLPIES